jgi:cell division protein FtsB
VTKKREMLLPKRFLYSFIVIVLVFFICFSSYEVWLGNDLAARFLPTLCGLLVTFGIFTVFFDIREQREWKEVEDRVKKRIGSEIFSLFTMLRDFCEVDRSLVGDIHNRETWKESERKQLKQMTEKVTLIEPLVEDLLEKKDLALNYASMFDSIRTRISEIEGKYGRFLNPKLRAALMDIQDYLDDLRFELKLGSIGNAEKLHQSLSTLIEKIVKEINNIRESGIDIGF